MMDDDRETEERIGRDSAGDRLRAAREAQGLSVADVAERTRIPSRHLAMIEKGDFAGLPAPTYSVGFVKTYARLLGLDAAAVSGQFRSELDYAAPVAAPAISYEPADPARTPTRAVAWTCFLIAVLLIGGYLYWRGTTADVDGVQLAAQGGRPTVEAPDAPPPPPNANPVAAPPPGQVAPAAAVATGGPAVITATSPVWLKIYEPAGPTHFMGMLQTGQSYTVPADAADPRLQTGRPNALEIKVGQTAIPALGAPEQLVKNVSLKPDALVARATPSATPAAANAAEAL